MVQKKKRMLSWSIQAAITNTMDWVAYKQQQFLSHSLGGW